MAERTIRYKVELDTSDLMSNVYRATDAAMANVSSSMGAMSGMSAPGMYAPSMADYSALSVPSAPYMHNIPSNFAAGAQLAANVPAAAMQSATASMNMAYTNMIQGGQMMSAYAGRFTTPPANMYGPQIDSPVQAFLGAVMPGTLTPLPPQLTREEYQQESRRYLGQWWGTAATGMAATAAGWGAFMIPNLFSTLAGTTKLLSMGTIAGITGVGAIAGMAALPFELMREESAKQAQLETALSPTMRRLGMASALTPAAADIFRDIGIQTPGMKFEDVLGMAESPGLPFLMKGAHDLETFRSNARALFKDLKDTMTVMRETRDEALQHISDMRDIGIAPGQAAEYGAFLAGAGAVGGYTAGEMTGIARAGAGIARGQGMPGRWGADIMATGQAVIETLMQSDPSLAEVAKRVGGAGGAAAGIVGGIMSQMRPEGQIGEILPALVSIENGSVVLNKGLLQDYLSGTRSREDMRTMADAVGTETLQAIWNDPVKLQDLQKQLGSKGIMGLAGRTLQDWSDYLGQELTVGDIGQIGKRWGMDENRAAIFSRWFGTEYGVGAMARIENEGDMAAERTRIKEFEDRNTWSAWMTRKITGGIRGAWTGITGPQPIGPQVPVGNLPELDISGIRMGVKDFGSQWEAMATMISGEEGRRISGIIERDEMTLGELGEFQASYQEVIGGFDPNKHKMDIGKSIHVREMLRESGAMELLTSGRPTALTETLGQFHKEYGSAHLSYYKWDLLKVASQMVPKALEEYAQPLTRTQKGTAYLGIKRELQELDPSGRIRGKFEPLIRLFQRPGTEKLMELWKEEQQDPFFGAATGKYDFESREVQEELFSSWGDDIRGLEEVLPQLKRAWNINPMVARQDLATTVSKIVQLTSQQEKLLGTGKTTPETEEEGKRRLEKESSTSATLERFMEWSIGRDKAMKSFIENVVSGKK